MLTHCDSQQIQPLYVHQINEVFQFEVVFRGQASQKDTRINRGLHREVLAVCLLVSQQVLIIHQDKIEVIDQHIGIIGEENNLPTARTLIQYEREKNTGFMGRNDNRVEKWFVFATIVNINDSKILVCIDNELTLLFYDIQSLVGGKRDSVLSKMSSTSASDRIDNKERGLLYQENLNDLSHTFDHMRRKQFDSMEYEDEIDTIKEMLKKRSMADEIVFNFEEGMNVLYTYVELNEK